MCQEWNSNCLGEFRPRIVFLGSNISMNIWTSHVASDSTLFVSRCFCIPGSATRLLNKTDCDVRSEIALNYRSLSTFFLETNDEISWAR